MAIAQIPPWLDVQPSQFASAAHSGAQLDLSRQEMEQRAQMEQQGLDVKRQAIASEAAQSSQQLQLKRQLAQAELEQSANTLQFKKQQLEVEHQKAQMMIGLKTQEAQRKLGAQQQYQQLIASGVDPTTAMLQIGPMLGASSDTLSAAFRDQASQRRATLPPEVFTTPDGDSIVRWGDTVVHSKKATAPKDESAPDKIDPRIVDATRFYDKQLSAIDKQLSSAVLPSAILKLQKDKEEIMKKRVALNPELADEEDVSGLQPSNVIKILKITQRQ